MICAQREKFVLITAPAALVDDASLTTTEVDTLGYDYAEIFLILGATDIAMTALAVTESDTSGSGHAAVTGLVYGTSTDISGTASTLPSATDDNKCFKFELDLRGRKRYLDLTATVGDGTAGGYYMAFALLSRADEAKTTAAGRGYANILRTQ